MNKFIFILMLISMPLYGQENPIWGSSEIISNENETPGHKTIISSAPGRYTPVNSETFTTSSSNNTKVRWFIQHPGSIGRLCAISNTGKYSVLGWETNEKRVSLYDTSSSTALWDYTVDASNVKSYVAISNDGERTAAGSYNNIYVFNRASSAPIFNLSLPPAASGSAGPVSITRNGEFVVACYSTADSSIIYGFNPSSTVPVWQYKVVSTIGSVRSLIFGNRMSGNDSLVIVNTYSEFLVFNTYTGALRHRGLTFPSSTTSGTQSPCGINGDGSVIATVNYGGELRVYKWIGGTYQFQWQDTEPATSWYMSVDISYDGQYIAGGTLRFLPGGGYDGKVKFFRSSAAAPVWVYPGVGENISDVSFSKSGNVLSAVTWGPENNSKPDIYIFKPFQGSAPVFTINTPGSFYTCDVSDNGKNVVASGKAVHATIFGYGGFYYNIDVDTNDVPTAITEENSFVKDYSLSQNYPNPFNPSTSIKYSLAKAGIVQLKIYDSAGKEVAVLVNNLQQQGIHSVNFYAANLSSGIYFYTLVTDDFTAAKKMLLIK